MFVPTGGAPHVLPLSRDICSSAREPVAVPCRPTSMVLLTLPAALVIVWPAARLWIGPVAAPPAAGGVLATSGTVWSAVFAASSANDRLACFVPDAVGLNVTVTVTAPLAGSFMSAGTLLVILNWSGFRPARYARLMFNGVSPVFVIVTFCEALAPPTAMVANFGAPVRPRWAAGVPASPEGQPPMPAAGPPVTSGPFS